MLVTLHVTFVILTLIAVAYADEQALLWVLGKKRTFSGKLVDRLHVAVSAGFALIIITGGALYAAAPAAYLSSATFIVKMVAVAALIINAYAIDRLSAKAVTHPFAELSHAKRVPLYISGGVSVLGWCVALLCGYLLG